MGMEPVALSVSAAATPERKKQQQQQQPQGANGAKRTNGSNGASGTNGTNAANGSSGGSLGSGNNNGADGDATPSKTPSRKKTTPSSPNARLPSPGRPTGSSRSPSPALAAIGGTSGGFHKSPSPARSPAPPTASLSGASSTGGLPRLGMASAAPFPTSPAIIRAPSPTLGNRKRVGRRTMFKKSASFKSRKDGSGDGNDTQVDGTDGGGGGGKSSSKKDANGKSKVKKKTTPVSKKNSISSSSSVTTEEDEEEEEEEEEEEDEGRLKQGPWFLKLAKTYHAQGDNPMKAFQFASRAIQCFEKSAAGKSSLDLVVSLHILAALQCRLGHFDEAVGLLERSLSIPNPEAGAVDHILASFAGKMQLGDTLALQGKQQQALGSYQSALQVQKQSLGDLDIRVAETCRYIAEAHLQAMQFDEAEELCELALRIHKEKGEPGSVEEAADRRLMAMVCSGKGDHESALEHLVLSSTVLLANGLDTDVAAVDATIGDALFALGRDTEAALSYQKALTVFKATKGENHAQVASVFASLAELCAKTGKPREARTYCESAMRIFGTNGAGHALEDVVYGLSDIAGVYDILGERDQAMSLLSRAVDIHSSAPGQTFTGAGIEAQLGILYFMTGKFSNAYTLLKSSSGKVKAASDEKKSLFLGLLLNQLGLAAVELNEIQEATGIFEESRTIMSVAAGPRHPDTLSVCSNLAGAYDAQGRTYEAIDLLEAVVDEKENKLGSVHPDVKTERTRLEQLLQDVGRTRKRKSNTLEELLEMAKVESTRLY